MGTSECWRRQDVYRRQVVAVNIEIDDDNIPPLDYKSPVATPSRPYHHGDLRRAYVAEAARIVETEGVSALALREIARRLGVSHAASKNHFPDKTALLAELAADGFEELAAELEAVKPSKSPLTHLRESGRAYVRFALRRPGFFRVMFAPGAGGRPTTQRLGEAGARAFDILQRRVCAAMPPARRRSPDRVREAVFLAWSVVHGAAMLILDGPLIPHVIPAAGGPVVDALIDTSTEAVARAIAE
jgi:AcrR family transcriptional regulator